ncbi:MAG: helicase IV [Gammaproteobacteria bacterium]|nr:MAG: helicase IV [Gammaproteobacteria bacterium]
MDNGLTFKENKWIALLQCRKQNVIQLCDQKIAINGLDVKPFEIDAVTSKNVFPWSVFELQKITIGYFINKEKQHITCIAPSGISQEIINNLHSSIQHALTEIIDKLDHSITEIQNNINLTFKEKTYIRHSKASDLVNSCKPIYKTSASIINFLEKNTFLSSLQKIAFADLKKTLNHTHPYIHDSDTTRHAYNKKYMDFFRVADADYFKRVESSPLTEEQIDAALTFEDATLVGAAAGSGKSSCIVGKIGFALKNNLFNDDEIIALAYNKDAAASLAERLEKKLSIVLNRKINVRSKTFHSFGLSILADHKGEDYSIRVLKEEGNEEGRCIKKAIENLITTNSEFQRLVADWICYASYESPQPVGISDDLDQCQKLYEECCLERIRARKNSDRKSYLATIPTFDDKVYVRSLEERSIANWLLLRGVQFSYEKADFEGGKRLGLPKTDAGKQRPYNPDFTYTLTVDPESETPTELTIIHEHFGLDEHGRAPDWMGGVKYEEQAKSKRKMLAQWIEDTASYPNRIAFFETRSSQIRNGSIWNLLETTLKRYGIPVSEPSDEIRERAINNFRESKEFEKTIIDFVMKYKDSGFDQAGVFDRAKRSTIPYRQSQFLKIAFMVLDAYQQELGERIDFPDMLREAIDILKRPSDKTYPKLVLVDEFQDISHLKASLVKALLDTQPNDSLVFFVGDDWQTINRFSGSDVSIFTGASDYFNRHTALLDLTKTFRCGRGIAEVSRDIVLTNKNQSRKQVVASDPIITNEIRIVFHGSESEDRQNAVHEALDAIIVSATQHLSGEIKNRLPSVNLLTRTTSEYTVPEGLDEVFLKGIAKHYKQKLEIRDMTIHKSKGLEADFIIMAGLESGPRGFPDERAPEPLFDLVLPTLTSSIEEERRLFYVGLTRARHQVIILANAQRPSPFIFELEKLKEKFSCIEWVPTDVGRKPCPKCKVGSLMHYKRADVCSRMHACGYRPKRLKNFPAAFRKI